MAAHRWLSPHGARRVALGLIPVIALGLSSCADSSDAGSSDVTVLEVTLGRFTIEPAVLSAPSGELELRVTNVDDALVHDLVVAGKGTKRLEPGKTQVLRIGEIGAGEYRMWCDVPGHAEAGQTGVLQVSEAAATTTVASG